MANTPVVVMDDTLEDIADAIRGKNGSSDTYKPGEMAEAIANIPGGGGANNNLAAVISGQTNALYDNDITVVRDAAFMLTEEDTGYITSISFPAAVTLGTRAFNAQGALTSVNFPNVETLGDRTFIGCGALTEIVLPSLHGSSSTTIPSVFALCSSIRKIDLGNNTTTMHKLGTDYFKSCSALEALVLRSRSVVKIVSTQIFNGSGIYWGDAYIYVPKNLIDAYKADSNWGSYSDQIRAIEDYSSDGTVNGDIVLQ